MRTRKAVIATVLVAAVCGPPSAAEAMQTSVRREGSNVLVQATGEPASDTAVAPQVNNIAVTQDGSGNLVVTDSSTDPTAVVPEGGCSQVSPNTVACPPDPAGRTALKVTTGLGNDAVVIDLPAGGSTGTATILVDGGPDADSIDGSAGPDTLVGGEVMGNGAPIPAGVTDGDDVITGRGAADTLRGGPGRDYLNGASAATGADGPNTLDGGAGSDFFDVGQSLGDDHVIGGPNEAPTNQPRLIVAAGMQLSVAAGDVVSYERRAFPAADTLGVDVDLDATADDGGTGEGDRIDPDVESLVGSARDDSLFGDGGAEVLEGGLGVDELVGNGGADTLRFRDGVRDECYIVDSRDTVETDLRDLSLDRCRVPVQRFPRVFTQLPVDETMAPPVIGTALQQAGSRFLVASVACARDAPKACSGTLTVQKPRGGRRLARKRYRVRPGRRSRVALSAAGAALKARDTARLTAVGRGVSRVGDTTVVALRRVR